MNADEQKTRSYYGNICQIINACAADNRLLIEVSGLNELNRAVTSIPKAGVDPDLTLWAARVSSWAMRKSLLMERRPSTLGRFFGGAVHSLFGAPDTTSEQYDRDLERIGSEWEMVIGDWELLIAILSSRYGEGFG
ncbi:hypothetical protein [Gemmata sp.]|uniref:hypothetical protein n=1 Tax=Gemmata sp. TaxID=1914242 RepID=UPI003F7155AD